MKKAAKSDNIDYSYRQRFIQVKRLRLPIKTLSILLTICFITSNATLSWSGVCVNQEGTHSFSETRSLSCHAQEKSGESHCFTLEEESFAPAGSEQECIDLLFSAEANLPRFNQKVIVTVQPVLYQYACIDSYAPHPKTEAASPEGAFIPDKTLQMQRAVVLLI